MAAVLKQFVVTVGNQVLLTSTVSRQRCTIGRLPDNNLVLPDAGVSAQHAEIRTEGDDTILTDLESETGTTVDGDRLLPLQPHVLRDAGTIQIGPYEIAYRLVRSEDRSEAVASPSIVDHPPEPADWSPMPSASELKFKVQRSAPAAPDHGAVGANSRYLQYLPVIFHPTVEDDQVNDFLGRYLQIFETIWEPLEQRQDHIHLYFSPRTCPTSWLPWFASWFGFELNPFWPEARVRALIAEGPELYRWRGTKYGLTRLLEVCTGTKPEITENPDEPFVFRVRVRLPANADPEAEATLDELIRAHKPAHTGYVLEVLQ